MECDPHITSAPASASATLDPTTQGTLNEIETLFGQINLAQQKTVSDVLTHAQPEIVKKFKALQESDQELLQEARDALSVSERRTEQLQNLKKEIESEFSKLKSRTSAKETTKTKTSDFQHRIGNSLYVKHVRLLRLLERRMELQAELQSNAKWNQTLNLLVAIPESAFRILCTNFQERSAELKDLYAQLEPSVAKESATYDSLKNAYNHFVWGAERPHRMVSRVEYGYSAYDNLWKTLRYKPEFSGWAGPLFNPPVEILDHTLEDHIFKEIKGNITQSLKPLTDELTSLQGLWLRNNQDLQELNDKKNAGETISAESFETLSGRIFDALKRSLLLGEMVRKRLEISETQRVPTDLATLSQNMRFTNISTFNACHAELLRQVNVLKSAFETMASHWRGDGLKTLSSRVTQYFATHHNSPQDEHGDGHVHSPDPSPCSKHKGHDSDSAPTLALNPMEACFAAQKREDDAILERAQQVQNEMATLAAQFCEEREDLNLKITIFSYFTPSRRFIQRKLDESIARIQQLIDKSDALKEDHEDTTYAINLRIQSGKEKMSEHVLKELEKLLFQEGKLVPRLQAYRDATQRFSTALEAVKKAGKDFERTKIGAEESFNRLSYIADNNGLDSSFWYNAYWYTEAFSWQTIPLVSYWKRLEKAREDFDRKDEPVIIDTTNPFAHIPQYLQTELTHALQPITDAIARWEGNIGELKTAYERLNGAILRLHNAEVSPQISGYIKAFDLASADLTEQFDVLLGKHQEIDEAINKHTTVTSYKLPSHSTFAELELAGIIDRTSAKAHLKAYQDQVSAIQSQLRSANTEWEKLGKFTGKMVGNLEALKKEHQLNIIDDIDPALLQLNIPDFTKKPLSSSEEEETLDTSSSDNE